MDHAIIPRAQTIGEAPRLSPLEAIVAWIANFLRMITGMKRRKVFPPNWKDHWQGLRELEWYRDQILAFAAQHVLSGGSLNDHTDFDLTLDIPDDYGICPRTPEAMNRRFIAMAQFRLNPDKYILRHIRRIARSAGITLTTDSSGCPLRHASHVTSPSLRLEEESTCTRRKAGAFPPPRKARGRWRASSRDGGGSRMRPLQSRARAPPTIPNSHAHHLAGPTSETAHPCPPPCLRHTGGG